MPDDERKPRRVGDETQARIKDLASGWTVESPAAPPPAAAPPAAAPPAAPAVAAPAEPARKKPRTNPPPPPGSAARKAIEDAIVEARETRGDPTDEGPGALGTPPLEARTAPSGPASTRSKPPAIAPGAARPRTPSGADHVVPATAAPRSQRPPGATGPFPLPPGGSGVIPASATAAMRSGPATQPPPVPPPPGRGRATQPPPIPSAARSGPIDSPRSPPFAVESRTPAVIVDDSLTLTDGLQALEPVPDGPPPLTGAAVPVQPSEARLRVPIGEFDSGVATIDDGKLRAARSDATIKRDAAEALLQIPGAPPTVVKPTPVEVLLGETAEVLRGDPTVIEGSTSRFERGDPTNVGDARGDATEIEGPSRLATRGTGGTLRAIAALRRKRGLLGDVRYVFTALFGVRESRRELGEQEHRQKVLQTSRRRHLVTLGRTAIATDSFDHPALARSREQLQSVEDERSHLQGQVAASDQELERVRRDRDTKARQYIESVTALDAELADLSKKIEPLEKEAAAARKKAAELRETLLRIAKKIAETEALFVSVKGEKMDKAGIQADLATLKADRQAVQRDEPMLASELDALNPRIASLEAARSGAQRKKIELEKSESEDQRRTSELLEAIGAKRKVVERAAADAEAARDNALFDLGERLYVDRPTVLAAQLSPIDQIDLELGETDRRIMELREILSNVDMAKLLRGSAMIFVAVALLGSFVAWLLYMLL